MFVARNIKFSTEGKSTTVDLGLASCDMGSMPILLPQPEKNSVKHCSAGRQGPAKIYQNFR
jgi:hypothetical protein